MDVAADVAAALPGLRVASVRRLGAGQENVAFEVNGELIVRYRHEPAPDRTDREARLLTFVAAHSPLPVPEPLFVTADCLAYRTLPGTPLLDLLALLDLPAPLDLLALLDLPAPPPAVPATLGRLLAALHAVPVAAVRDLVDTDHDPLEQWRDEAAELYESIVDEVPARHRPAIAAFLRAPLPAPAPASVFSHNDLGIEHVLVDPATWAVTGVIDWSDAALTDPAYDIGLVYRDLGPAALSALLDAYGSTAPRERAVCYARWSVFEDLAYGLTTGLRPYVVKSLRSLTWLFPG